MAEIVMPKFGLTMTEGLIAVWHRRPGEAFRKGDILFEVETDKAANEVEATDDGVLDAILHDTGAVVPPGEPIAKASFRTGQGVDLEAPAPLADVAAPNAAPYPRGNDAPSARKLMAEHGIDRSSIQGSGRDGRAMKHDVLRVIATPYARRLARDAGIDLNDVTGSGTGGRVKASDVTAAASVVEVAVPPQPAPEFVAPDAARLAIARRVQSAKRDIPHFYLTRHVDVGPLGVLRATLNASEGRTKISMTHMLVKALGLALVRLPAMNRIWLPDGILPLAGAAVGIVTETPAGLRIPVVSRADSLPLDTLAEHCGGLLERARAGRMKAEDVPTAAISISNVGMLGADTVTPIISPPQAMILGVGAEQQMFRPDARGQPELRREVILTLAADHRSIDGADGARFLATLAWLIEAPVELLRSPPIATEAR